RDLALVALFCSLLSSAPRLSVFPTRRSSDLEAELFDAFAVSRLGREVQRLNEWASDTETGDRDELAPGVSDQAWRQVSVSSRERSEEHTSELQSREKLVCRLLLEKKNKKHVG